MSRPRRGPLVAVLLLGGGAAAWHFLRPSFLRDGAEVVETLPTDDRIRHLVAPCGFTLPFEADTTDMTHVLVETLARGQRDALKQAREELAGMGPAVLPELERRFDASYAQAFEHGILENVLGVCTIASEPWGVGLLRRGARHPQETVRLRAVAGLARHGGPEDYDYVAGCMPLTTTPQSQGDILDALHVLDRERYGSDFAGWLERGEYPLLWRHGCALVGDLRSSDTIARLQAQADQKPADMKPFLLGPAAREGDEQALAYLRAALGDATPMTREQALRALGSSGLGHEVHVVLELDLDRRLRLLAAQPLAALPPSEETREWLSIGLADVDADVRAVCLGALCARGDPRAIAEALEALRGDARSRELGIGSLRGAFAAEPATIARAFDSLTALCAQREGGDPDLYVGTLRALAQVPGAPTARFRLARGRSLEGRISSWRAFRWCVFHAINSGPEGRAVFRAELATELDPLRRIDFLEVITQDTDDEVREILRGLIDDPATDPHERVYASALLIRQGPAKSVAPYLKRIWLATTDPVVRPALHCLLWAWYGAASER